MRLPNEQAAAQPQACIFLLQLGGPKDLAAIESFLRNLFEDVLPLPALLRKPLAWFIARRRTPEVTPLYQEIGGGSPLLANTEAQAAALSMRLQELGTPCRVLVAMRYAPPRCAAALTEARQYHASVPWVALPLYPQYSYATTRSSLEELTPQLSAVERQQLRVVADYHDDPQYVRAVAACIQRSLEALPPEVRQPMHLVFSAHGLPMTLVRDGDPYPGQIAQTVAAVMACLPPGMPHTLCYQSRVGPVRWLEPATITTLQDLAKRGQHHVMVVPISFVSEHIETLHELDIQLRDIAKEAGITHYVRVPTVSCDAPFINALAQQVLKALRG